MKNNKHPHHDLIVELSRDMNKKIQFKSSLVNDWVDSDIEDLVSDNRGLIKFRLKPQ